MVRREKKALATGAAHPRKHRISCEPRRRDTYAQRRLRPSRPRLAGLKKSAVPKIRHGLDKKLVAAERARSETALRVAAYKVLMM